MRNIAIITGGIGSERSVSLRSAEALNAACVSLGYYPIVFDATAQGYAPMPATGSYLSEDILLEFLRK